MSADTRRVITCGRCEVAMNVCDHVARATARAAEPDGRREAELRSAGRMLWARMHMYCANDWLPKEECMSHNCKEARRALGVADRPDWGPIAAATDAHARMLKAERVADSPPEETSG